MALGSCSLRNLKDCEVNTGLSILYSNLRWLEERGIRQWSVDLIRRTYPEYQKTDENFVLECDNRIVAVLSMHKSPPAYWRDKVDSLNYRFLSKLAVDVGLRGQGFGRRALHAVKQLLHDEKVEDLFIEISGDNEFLAQYYKASGFCVAGRIEIELESGFYNMVLMKCSTGE